ncbi:hypothetical protein Tco_1003209 [Tanacetum coccineum]|uniref:Uncharacterized protein n=1 Tax=Tanacetum coccineum TaxID=301880 RepID=A0ABQ5F8F5_9ASTR
MDFYWQLMLASILSGSSISPKKKVYYTAVNPERMLLYKFQIGDTSFGLLLPRIPKGYRAKVIRQLGDCSFLSLSYLPDRWEMESESTGNMFWWPLLEDVR